MMSKAYRPNSRRVTQTSCPGQARIIVDDKNNIIVSKYVPCDGSHTSHDIALAATPDAEAIDKLVDENIHDGVCAVVSQKRNHLLELLHPAFCPGGMNSRKVEIIFESPCTFGFGLRHRINRVLGEKVYTWCRGVCKKRERKQKQLVICALRVRCTQSTIQSVINPLSHPPRGLIVPLRHPSSQTTTIPVSCHLSKGPLRSAWNTPTTINHMWLNSML